MQTGDDPNYSYIDWPTGPGYTPQPSLDAAPYFPSEHTLHIVSPTGGTLKVTGKDGNELSDGSKIVSGTLLTLSYTESPNYRFSEYLSGSSADNLRTLAGNTIPMPATDLYLSARFNYEDPTPPPAPIYYSVFLPSVEGAVTDPVAGTYDVESWSTFRFYLTLDTAYSQSQPVVTTSRGETLQPRTSDGAYLLKYVRTDVEVYIDGILLNPPPVANEPHRRPRAGDMERRRLSLHPPSRRPADVARPHLYGGRPPARQLPFNPGVDASAIADGDLYRAGG